MRTTKLFFLLAAMLFFQAAHAQKKSKTSFFTGGDVFLFSNKSSNPPEFPGDVNEASLTSVQIQPLFGKKLNKYWRAGVMLDLSLSNSKQLSTYALFSDTTTVTQKANAVGLGGGLFAIYTLMPKSDFSFFIMPNLFFDGTTTKSTVDDGDPDIDKASSFGLSVNLGALYQFNDRWTAVMNFGGAGYNFTSNTYQPAGGEKTDPMKVGNFFAGFGLSSLNFGFWYNF